jgi:hypothetical protein
VAVCCDCSICVRRCVSSICRVWVTVSESDSQLDLGTFLSAQALQVTLRVFRVLFVKLIASLSLCSLFILVLQVHALCWSVLNTVIAHPLASLVQLECYFGFPQSFKLHGIVWLATSMTLLRDPNWTPNSNQLDLNCLPGLSLPKGFIFSFFCCFEVISNRNR